MLTTARGLVAEPRPTGGTEDEVDRTGCDRHAGAIILDDESTARVVLEDWLLDYYDIDVECLSEHLTTAEYLYAAAHEN